jgi:hypothetical protein
VHPVPMGTLILRVVREYLSAGAIVLRLKTNKLGFNLNTHGCLLTLKSHRLFLYVMYDINKEVLVHNV